MADIFDNITDASTSNGTVKFGKTVDLVLALAEGDVRLAKAAGKLRVHSERLLQQERVR